MSGVGEASLVLGIISSIISIVDATKQVYEAVEDEAGLPTNFKKSATKLPLISKLLEDAERYVNNVADESVKAAFTPTLEDCKVQATHLQELFEKVMPEEGDSRWERYVKAARTIGKGGRVESLVGRILDDLQLLTTKFPENRLKENKDKLLRKSIDWIFQHPQYISWKDGDDICLLWIRGGAGKGKTMMSIGLIEHLLLPQDDSTVVTYFFCQNADYELNTLEAIIKGLILQLVNQQKELKESLRRRWDTVNGRFGEDVTSWRMLWDILLEMLEHCKCQRVYVIVDALDECQNDGMADLLKRLVRTGLQRPSKVKWLLTSRPLDCAEQELLAGSDQVLVSLELNSKHVSEAVKAYIAFKVHELDRRRSYGETLRQEVETELTEKAEDTYLWSVHRDKALTTIQDLPPGLHPLYHRVFNQLSKGELAVVSGCVRLLKLKKDPSLSMLVRDATRFLLRHYSTIATWPLQIYSSAIVFSPQTSVVRRINLDKLPVWFRKLPQVENSWASLIQTLAGHSDSVRAIAFSPDGKQIASGSDDRTIKLWDATTGDLQKTLAGHSDWVTAVAFSPDGKQIASGSDDWTIKLWDATTGDLQKTLAGHSDSVRAITFSPDGKQIASGSDDRTIKLWDVAKALKISRLISSTISSRFKFRAWQEIKTLQTVDSLKFSVDGRYLATNLGVVKIESTIDKQIPGFKSLKNLRVNNQWICYGAVPVFLLPSDFKLLCYDVRGDQVAVGFTNGRVLSFDIDRISLNSIFKNSA
ncbi:hypothetical protein F5884DRAFT_825522 [Xylogone sp. PMI_703]|nr:hypothetical protein F5884DRAFT_825522 [Xylogone sp. PMI_703]